MTHKFKVKTSAKCEMSDITVEVAEIVRVNDLESGVCHVFVPHTTCALAINENADPDVVRDLLLGLDRAFPDRAEFRHAEGNSRAHLKASCVGSSATVIVRGGKPLLGTWQGIWFCEFDGPRERRFFVKVMRG